MPSPRKEKLLEELDTILQEKTNFVILTYAGLDVASMQEFRRAIREADGRLKVVKNNIFRLVLQASDAHKAIAESLEPSLAGPIAVAFCNGNFPAVSKLAVKYAGSMDPITVKSACMDGAFLNEQEVKAIAALPSMEEMLGIIGRGLNAPATKIATGISQIITGLARGIQEVGRKNG